MWGPWTRIFHEFPRDTNQEAHLQMPCYLNGCGRQRLVNNFLLVTKYTDCNLRKCSNDVRKIFNAPTKNGNFGMLKGVKVNLASINSFVTKLSCFMFLPTRHHSSVWNWNPPFLFPSKNPSGSRFSKLSLCATLRLSRLVASRTLHNASRNQSGSVIKTRLSTK